MSYWAAITILGEFDFDSHEWLSVSAMLANDLLVL
jgi:hypothetical protein